MIGKWLHFYSPKYIQPVFIHLKRKKKNKTHHQTKIATKETEALIQIEDYLHN